MRASLSGLLAALVLSATLLQAGDFWAKTKFPDWTDKEVRDLLADSPWSRPVLVSMGTMAGGGIPPMPAEQKAQGGCIPCEASGGGRVSMGPVRMPELAGPVTLRVSWHSALPVKQALARIRFGEEVWSAAAAEMLSRDETAYIVGVTGVPRQWIPDDPSKLKAGAFLRVKGLPPRQPYDVRAAPERESVSLLFLFPKGQDGHRIIVVEDRQVEVDVKFAASGFSRKFNLKEMVYEGRLEM